MRTLLTIIIFLTTTQAFAWWETPHMLVAQLAYNKLTPETKKWADSLLDQDFVTASVWADDIRAKGNTEYSTWHYVNLNFENINDPMPNAGSFPSKNHVAWAIRQEIKTLKCDIAKQEEKTQALKRLIHWVGDLHQPLHAASHVSPNYPKGDKGGNEFLVNLPKPYNNLHSLWDSGLDRWDKVHRPLTPDGKAYLQAEAAHLTQQNTQPINTKVDPYAWAIESHRLARAYAYTGINYKGVPSPAYTEQGQKISEEQVYKAGLRLAAILNEINSSLALASPLP